MGASHSRSVEKTDPRHFKDEILDRLAERYNVAQFVSFGPASMAIRYCRILGTNRPESGEAAIRHLLKTSVEKSVNVRSYEPFQSKSRAFHYGLTNADEVLTVVRSLQDAGLHTIVNETIDTGDGGVSGVVSGGICEFAPDDTPRCVEKPGTAAFTVEDAEHVLTTVYGFDPALDFEHDLRVEFSLHPQRRGLRHEHMVVWESEHFEGSSLTTSIRWPNRFSRMLGDKVFGLLVADAIGLHVPETTVVNRRVAPFRFGVPTGTGETWIRTAPTEQLPGRFTTQKGWIDPYALLLEEDPDGHSIASVIAQEGVDSVYAGALLAQEGGSIILEGVRGTGEDFMVGVVSPDRIPRHVRDEVTRLYERARARLGPVRMEWGFDGTRCWVLQLHVGAVAAGASSVIYPGDAGTFHRFAVEDGIEDLRALINRVQGTGAGIVLVGNVGITSHFGDLLRRAQVPSRIESA
ncbi:MAG TPA: hypothetical protein VIG64_11400 [Actinomycetota bacterium]|jgi:hypothetical protein